MSGIKLASVPLILFYEILKELFLEMNYSDVVPKGSV